MVVLALVLALTSAAPPAPRSARPAPATEQPPARAPANAAPPKPAERKPPTLESFVEYDLATPEGVVSLTWPSIAYDREHDELFVAAEGFVRIFDKTGMEVHRFGDDGSLGYITRAAPMEDGQIVVLTSHDGKRAYIRCDFRGEPLEEFKLTNLPKGFDDLDPDQMVYRDGRLYFAERGSMRVVVTDTMGEYRLSYNLRNLMAAAIARDPDRGERKIPAAMDGFNVDAKGTLYFTMSTAFAGGVFNPNGTLRIFGGRGSTPGKFNVIGGIDVDENGYVFVTDRLRSVVSVWTPDLRHVGDFGYRGSERWNLLTPYEIAVGNNKVFVTQAGNRGVKVYRVKLTEPAEEPEPKPAS